MPSTWTLPPMPDATVELWVVNRDTGAVGRWTRNINLVTGAPLVNWTDGHRLLGWAALLESGDVYDHDPLTIDAVETANRRADAVERLLGELDHRDGGEYLLEHLAEHGPAGLDVQAAARAMLDAREDES